MIFCFLRQAFGHGRLGHPQSLEYLTYLNTLFQTETESFAAKVFPESGFNLQKSF